MSGPERLHAVDCKEQLETHGLLGPPRTVVVEGRDTLRCRETPRSKRKRDTFLAGRHAAYPLSEPPTIREAAAVVVART